MSNVILPLNHEIILKQKHPRSRELNEEIILKTRSQV